MIPKSVEEVLAWLFSVLLKELRRDLRLSKVQRGGIWALFSLTSIVMAAMHGDRRRVLQSNHPL